MTTHFGVGMVKPEEFKEKNFYTESTVYDVEKDKSSDIALLADGFFDKNMVMKKKERRFDKAVYESFMLDFWNNLLDLYTKETGTNFLAPESKDILYDFDTRESLLVMEQMPGKALKKVSNGKEFNYFEPLDMELQKADAISYMVGGINKIKESEMLVHGDYDARHILFYRNPETNDHSLSVIDVENSRLEKDLENVYKETITMEEELDKHLPSRQEYFYDKGYQEVESLYCREDIIEQTQKMFNEKYKKEGKPLVKVDPFKKEVEY